MRAACKPAERRLEKAVMEDVAAWDAPCLTEVPFLTNVHMTWMND